MSIPHPSRAASALDDSSEQAGSSAQAASSEHSQAELDDLYQYQLCGAAAEIAAAIAHAVGTPLNVISGRAELIRQDPTNALPQVTRIEEQVRKLADGLRDFVEYLTSDSRSTGDVLATQLLARACSLVRPVTDQHRVELVVDDAALASAPVAQRSLSNLVTLLSWAVRCTAGLPERKLQVVGSVIEGSGASGGAVFEFRLPGLALPEHWRIERFEANPPSADSEAFRMVAICAAIARGQGGKLQADALPASGAPASGAPASGAPSIGAPSSGVRVRLVVRAAAS
ncbi:MAG: hypothetical protein RL033_826 [Pseudomonadota bacterium]|jgi:hypothetical protein